MNTKENILEKTEDELFEEHCDLTHEISHIARHIVDLQKRILNMSEKLDLIEQEMERRENKTQAITN